MATVSDKTRAAFRREGFVMIPDVSGGEPGIEELAGQRETVYYRLHASGHRERRREAVTAPLAEFR
ncbi:hypothetical protein AB0O64_03145 [Streptomyces sp. NPDC088341]|uniref:hypothetical protein n=1 Tax=Streptomyces sp. NPDC088341 TaxID=3154870 RepID=UPI00341C0AA3